MKKKIHTFLTVLIVILAMYIAAGNTVSTDIRWVAAVYWFLIAIRASLEL